MKSLERKLASELPTKDWELARLNKFIVNTYKRVATDVYWMGVAFTFAKLRVEELEGSGIWMEYCKSAYAEISYSFISRSMQVAAFFGSNPKELEGKKVTEAYRLAGIIKSPNREKSDQDLEKQLLHVSLKPYLEGIRKALLSPRDVIFDQSQVSKTITLLQEFLESVKKAKENLSKESKVKLSDHIDINGQNVPVIKDSHVA